MVLNHDFQRFDIVTPEKIKCEFLGLDENGETILNLFDKHSQVMESLIGISTTKATFKKYSVTRKHVANFIKKKFLIKRLEQVRDIFVFACFTGLSYIDVKELSKDHIRVSFDRNTWIMTKRSKSNVNVNVPLMDIPKKILRKYESELPDDKVLPVLSNQKMNVYLKEIGDVCGITKNLTFHLARHTFATTVTLAKGIPIETVSKMLGHTNIQTTQIYARITNEKISKDMRGLSAKFNDSEKLFG